uniref:Guanine nucleotide-binding protein subunit beta-like protein n=1 Tax=Eutreptiella gymnastica TaxID=73025 RepID=A0A7S4C775_9EUGL
MTVRTWAGDGTGLSAFRGARKPVTAVAVTATRLYVASADLSIREFDLASQEPTNVFIHNEPIVALAVCGARLFVASEGGLVRVANVNRAASADDVAMARV